MVLGKNRQVVLISRPDGIPQAENFSIVESMILVPSVGQVVVQNEWLSVEPAMRGWVSAVANYSEPVALGSVMRSYAAGRIVASQHPDWPVGTAVTGMFGWQEFALVDSTQIQRRIDEVELPLSTALGVLGTNGITAHYGLLQVGQPKPGETVVVSTAAGAVGSCVGQIANLHGCRTVGIAGGEAKRRLCLERFGFDAAVDYKAADFSEHLAEACSGGVDVYFDNTAGPITDAVMAHLNIGARIVVCGTASVPSWSPPPLGPRAERDILVKRARMQGFVIFDHLDYYEQARADLAEWVRGGHLAYAEDVLDGIEAAPDAIAGLYRGENLGKRLIRLSEKA
ncbi:NADP-dependent oxidoreductase [Cupriavidus necator]|uniref:NADP-dependent oxidoreductase n=1 Tax=Cupriavidus necator TaxID=106590 RepID=A0A367PI67_CUPNE|nr:NADP-dependent oxidoreductase [Cupriavidus necator]QQX86701.1 NADP-dependent oxidoreductase [Cupriavidus necator]RCJ07223.1 NADP-dependent oxidoreductase [Cupriavidus necator]